LRVELLLIGALALLALGVLGMFVYRVLLTN
jgi:hypothetical protein